MKRREKQNLMMSFRHAFDGVRFVVLSERNARVHILVAGAVIRAQPLAWTRLDRVGAHRHRDRHGVWRGDGQHGRGADC